MGITLRARAITPDEASDLLDNPRALGRALAFDAPGVLDLDKSWDGVLWLVSEERRERPYMMPDPSLPVTQALVPPGLVRDDMRFRYARPDRVRLIDAALGALDPASLDAHFDPEAMERARVYPSIWRDDPDGSLAYLRANVLALRDLYADAARRGAYVFVLLD